MADFMLLKLQTHVTPKTKRALVKLQKKAEHRTLAAFLREVLTNYVKDNS